MSLIEIRDVHKWYGEFHVLKGISERVEKGEVLVICGPSGSGKSSLIRCLNRLEPIQKGDILFEGTSIYAPEVDVNALRAEVGMVFQQFNLVDRMSVLRNVMLGALSRTALWRSLLGFFHEEDARLAYKALARVGIMEKAHQRNSNLSGRQQQRAAIARALEQRARVLLADEPIASLDPESSRNVMETLRDLNQKDGLTVLVTLHQVDYALSFCPRTIALKHGRVVYDGPSAELTPAFLKRLYGTECDSLFARQESDIRRNPPLTQVQVA